MRPLMHLIRPLPKLPLEELRRAVQPLRPPHGAITTTI